MPSFPFNSYELWGYILHNTRLYVILLGYIQFIQDDLQNVGFSISVLLTCIGNCLI